MGASLMPVMITPKTRRMRPVIAEKVGKRGRGSIEIEVAILIAGLLLHTLAFLAMVVGRLVI